MTTGVLRSVAPSRTPKVYSSSAFTTGNDIDYSYNMYVLCCGFTGRPRYVIWQEKSIIHYLLLKTMIMDATSICTSAGNKSGLVFLNQSSSSPDQTMYI